MRRAVRRLLLIVALGGLVFLFVLPGRTWLQQRSAMSVAQHRLQVLDSENQALAKRAAQLQSPPYVERIARDQYGLVLPNEKAYGLIPPAPTAAATAPTTSVPQTGG